MGPGAPDLPAFVRAYWTGPSTGLVSWRSGALPTRIGLLDMGLVRDHPVLQGARVQYRAQRRAPTDPWLHGTGSASILVGPRGLCPDAELFVAQAVGSPGAFADGVSWLVDQEVEVIAMPVGVARGTRQDHLSLCRAAVLGVRLYASAGNHGPHRRLFPAGHGAVVAVTGAHPDGAVLACCCAEGVDLRAPGLSVPAITPEGWGTVSGSSPAAVIAAALDPGQGRAS